MQRILVATDFSTRSDRAVQRATLLAREFGAEVILLTVVDDDQPKRLLDLEQREATALLHDLARTVHQTAAVPCKARVELGEPFQRIVDAAEDCDADLICIGPHRRQALRDIFIGTTAERTIRHSRRPVLMANAVPARRYDRIVLATDFSDSSAHAVETARRLRVLDNAAALVIHAFEALLRGPIASSSMNLREYQDYLDRERKNAERAMSAFLGRTGFESARRAVEFVEHSAPQTIRRALQRERANLVVVGTHGKRAAERFLLGSVAEEMFHQGDVDVLAVPPAAEARNTLES